MGHATENILPQPQLRLASSLKNISFMCDHCQQRIATKAIGRREVCCDECLGADPALRQKFEEALLYERSRRAVGGPLTAIAREQTEINRANGWEPLTTRSWDNVEAVLAKLAMVGSEVGEFVEAVRLNDRENAGEEAADIILRVASLSWQLGIDLDAHVRRKMEANRERPYQHGGKRA